MLENSLNLLPCTIVLEALFNKISKIAFFGFICFGGRMRGREWERKMGDMESEMGKMRRQRGEMDRRRWREGDGEGIERESHTQTSSWYAKG